MRATQYYLATLKEAPQEAELASHKLMLRAGLIRKLASGLYSWMPLGLRVLKKVEAIVREEMNRAGALEMLAPPIQPRELWEETGRWDLYGPMMLRIKDRAEREFCYAPDRRGSDVRHRAQGDPQLPPAAGELLPDPDQVPRRDPPALRRDARARVHDEGRVFVRRRLRGPEEELPGDVRRVHAHLHAPGPRVPRGRRRHGRDRRHGLPRVPGARGLRRGRDRLFPGFRLRGERGARGSARAFAATRRALAADEESGHARQAHVRGSLGASRHPDREDREVDRGSARSGREARLSRRW